MPSSAATAVCTLSLHDALPICARGDRDQGAEPNRLRGPREHRRAGGGGSGRSLPRSQPQGPRREDPSERAALAARRAVRRARAARSEEHTSELQSRGHLVCRLLLQQRSALFPYTTLFRSALGVIATRALSPIAFAALASTDEPAAAAQDDRCRDRNHKDHAVRIHRSGPLLLRAGPFAALGPLDRKSTRLNSSHVAISYAVFCCNSGLHSFPTRRSSDLRSG